jgi:hypothetical protein
LSLSLFCLSGEQKRLQKNPSRSLQAIFDDKYAKHLTKILGPTKPSECMELNANMPAMQSCHSIADHHFHYTLGLGKVQGVYDIFVHNHMV